MTSRRLLAVAAAVLAAAAVAALVLWPTHRRPVAVLPARPTPTSTPSSSAPPAPAVPHQFVAAAAPTQFLLTGPSLAIHAHVCSMPAVFPLDPPGEQHHTVCWVEKGFGVRPGSDTATSYVLGHSWAEDDLEVLNGASAPVTASILHTKPQLRDGVPTYPSHVLDGDRIVLQTATGTLTYLVHDTYAVAKDKLGLVSSTMDQHVAHRLVVITCAELHGVDYHFNVVITAYLWSSVARGQALAASAASIRSS